MIDADPSSPGTAEPGPLALSEDVDDAARSESYTVKLAAAPTGLVTVTVTSRDASAVTVGTDGVAFGSQTTLTFGPNTWNTARTVTARAVQDLDADSESVAIAHEASGGGYAGVSAPLTATVDDDDTPALVVDADPSTLVVDAGPLILEEAAAPSGSYAVRLAFEPTATTTVTVASDNDAVAVNTADGTAGAQATLTFTTTDWNMWQTVTATTTGDADAADEVSNVVHTASGAVEYAGVTETLRIGVQDDAQAGTDYDSDEDGLIEIATLAQLNAVRWDLDGDGVAASSATTTYAAAFPGAAAGMGCPDGSDSNAAPDACTGYELAADLDFDTDGDGSTWAGGTPASDSGDAYHNGGDGWLPIGASNAHFNTAFDGNGRVIWNLFVSRNVNHIGLFGFTGTAARITSVGLANARVQSGNQGVGALVGYNRGRIAASWSSGSTRGGNAVGGLVGQNGTASGLVVASYSVAAVECTGGAGLVAGGLAGFQDGSARIVTSYATGAVTGSCDRRRGIVARDTALDVTSTYWDVDLSGIALDGNAAGEGRSTAQLQTPTAYGTTTPYSAWDDVDVDGDGVGGGGP